MIKKYNKEINDNILNQMYKILIDNLFITYPNFLENKEKHDNEANKNRWINMIKNTDNYNVITFEEKNEVLGFLNYSIIEDEMWISEVQIKENHKNKKILKNLLKEFMLIDELKKYKYIIIHINDNNEISKKVFKHIGFYDIGNTLYKIDKNILINYLNK